MKYLCRGLALLVTSLLSLSPVGTGVSRATDAQAMRHMEQTIGALKRMTDADSLAAAGLLSLEVHPEQSMHIIERARAAAPTRADLIWLHAEVCTKITACDPVPIENQLHAVDPANAAGSVGALERAYRTDDEDAKETALTAIGQAERFDIYWLPLISRLSEAVIAIHRMSPQEAVVTVTGFLAAAPIPGFEARAKTCKGARLQRAAVLDACRGVARVLQNGDTYLIEMIGAAIAKRVWPRDSAEWKAADDARRAYDYRSKIWLKLDIEDDAHAVKYLELCSKYRREQDLFLAQIIDAGANPNPPAD